MLVSRYLTNAYDIGHVVTWISALLVSVKQKPSNAIEIPSSYDVINLLYI